MSKAAVSPPRRVVGLWAVAICLALAGLAPNASGTDYLWSSPIGSWAYSDNWLPHGIPGAGDSAKVAGGGTATIDEGGAICHDLFVGGENDHGTVQMIAGSLTVVNDEFLGHDDHTGVFVQTAGTHNIGDLLLVGGNYQGSFTFSGGLLTAKREYIGEQAAGSFVQNGGVHLVANEMILAKGQSGNGSYTMNSGTLSVAGSIVKGLGTTSYFTLNGGTVSVGDAFGVGTTIATGGSMSVTGQFTGSFLTWNADWLTVGGNVNVGSQHYYRGNVSIGGMLNADYLTWEGGSLMVGGNVEVGTAFLKKGTVTFNGSAFKVADVYAATGAGDHMDLTIGPGQTMTVMDGQDVATTGIGNFTLAGGTHSVFGNLQIAADATAVGTYRLSSGSLYVGGGLTGGNGTSTFILDGGTVSVEGGSISATNFYLGDAGGTDVAYTFDSANRVISQRLEIGRSGKGTLSQVESFNSVGVALSLGVNPGGNGTYILNGASASLGAQAEYVGYAGTGLFNHVQGTNTVMGNLSIGDQAGSSGTYKLQDGGLSASSEYVGNQGAGVLEQTGGFNGPANFLAVANAAGSSGTYKLTGGQITTPCEYIGSSGTGRMEQSGSTTNWATSGIYIGFLAGGSGTYVLSSGTLQCDGSIYLGANPGSSGTVTQTRGTVNVTSGGLHVGYESNASGSYTISGGALNAKVETVGYSGGGTFTQSGGANTITTNLALGAMPGSSGTYDLSGLGNLSAASEMVGALGYGSFTQSGGTNTVNGLFTLGLAPGGQGSYALSGTGQVEAQAMAVGYGGVGYLSQSAGQCTIAATLSIADQPGSIGQAQLGGGTLWAFKEVIGNSGNGSFTQTGGSHFVATDMVLAQNAGSTGLFRLTAGTAYLDWSVTSGAGNSFFIVDGGVLNGPYSIAVTNLYIGDAPDSAGVLSSISPTPRTITAGYYFVGKGGTGTVTHGSGFTSVDYEFSLGVDSSGKGTYTLTGGSSTLQAALEYIGRFGTGTFTQDSGVNYAGPMYVGAEYGSTGSYTLSGTGEVDVNYLHVGKSGTGTFTQSGGGSANYVMGPLYVGTDYGSSGLYKLIGGTLSVDDVERIGEAGTGTFTHTGGTNSVAAIYIGCQPTGNGTYNFWSNTSLSVGDLYVGCSGVGTFSQGANTVSVTRDLVIASSAGGTGTYTSTSGTLAVTGSLYVGSAGSGSFVQTGGGTTVGGNLSIADQPGSVGSYKMTGTSPSLGANYEYVGGAGAGTFTQTAGTNTCSRVYIADQPGSSGAYYLQGGLLQADFVASNGTFSQTGGTFYSSELDASSSAVTTVSGSASVFAPLTVNNDGSFTLSGGTIRGPAVTPGTINNNGSFTQTGGAMNDYLMNYGTYTFSGGTVGWSLQNWGTAQINANFAADDGIVNYGSLTVAAGKRAAGNGSSGVDNYGTVVLKTGATLAGAGVTNEPGAVLSGNGSINASFTNYGLVQPDGVLITKGLSTNQGDIVLNAGTGYQAQGAMTNRGTLDLCGGSVSGVGAVTNDGGLIHAIAPALMALANLTGGNINGGEIRIDTGSSLAVNSAFANSGTIVLKGATSVLSGGTVTNTGSISGLGRVSNAVLNSGTVRAEGGLLTVAGASCTNTASGRFEVAAGSTALVSQGIAANAGTIALLGGTFDNNARAMASTGVISGYGTLHTGGLTNHGHVGVGGGNLDVFGSVSNAVDGVVEASSGSMVTFYGPASGPGNFPGSGSVRFLGGYSPGNSPGIITFGGDLVLGGANKLTMELAENDNTNPACPRYDELNVAHNISIAGEMDLIWTPRAGEVASKFGGTYDLITYVGQLDGTFSVKCGFSAYIAGINYAADAGGGRKAVRLTLYHLLDGDADLDGQVGRNDLAALGAGLHIPSPIWQNGDFDLDGKVTPMDYLALKANWGRTASGGPVPEPATLALLAAGAVALLRRRGGR
jgi:T5SS/PEP-CTERM-associated repeat protein